MSNPINVKVNPYQQQQTGRNQQLPTVDTEKLKKGVNNNPISKNANGVDNPGVLLGLMVPIWVGLSKVMDKFNTACADRADGGRNVLQKIGDFETSLAKSPIFDNPVSKAIGKAFNGTKGFIKTKIVDKSSILRAFAYTPTKPTNKMAMMQYIGTSAEVANDATMAFEKYTEKGKNIAKVNEFGFKNYASTIENPNSKQNIEEIIKACRKKGGQEFVDMTKPGKGQWFKKLMGRKIYWSATANKLEALTGKQALPKTTIRVLESLTNGTAGGKLAILMQTYILADALIKTYKAPKGEKTSTFMENVIYNAGWYLLMPFGLKTMHRVGGLQNIGMSKARYRKYEKAFEQFDKKAKANGFASQAEYDTALNALKEMKNGKAIAKTMDAARAAGHNVKPFTKTVKWYQKPLIAIGNLVDVGLGTVRPYMSKETGVMAKLGNGLKKAKFGMKNAAGYPMRFGIFMFMIAPFLGKISAKASHVIFGKPTKSVLDDEPTTETPKTPAGQPAAVPGQAVKTPAQTPIPAQLQPQVQTKPAPSLINAYTTKTAPTATPQAAAPQANPFTTAPAVAQAPAQAQPAPQPAPAKSAEPVRTYIPSSEGVKITQTGPGVDKANAAINKADLAEQEALKYLAGK